METMEGIELLAQAFVNGNRKDVLGTLERMKPLQAVYTALRIAEELNKTDRGILLRMLENRL